MITKEEFTKLILEQNKWHNQLKEVGRVLNCNPLEIDWVEYGERLFNNLIVILFGEDAAYTIYWWLVEKPTLPPGAAMWDEEGNEIPTETIEDLWNIVKDYRK